MTLTEAEKRATAELILDPNWCSGGQMLATGNKCSTLSLQEGKDIRCLRYDCPYNFYEPKK